jgi:hypothetical protein
MPRNTYLSATLRCCSYADSLLRILQSDVMATPIQSRALLDGAIFHMYTAHLMHLREIADNYACVDIGDIASASELIVKLAEQDKAPAEAGEINALAEGTDNWLSLILRAYHEIVAGLDLAQEPMSDAGIILRQTETESPLAYDMSDVTGWLQAMNECFERHRSLMFEC